MLTTRRTFGKVVSCGALGVGLGLTTGFSACNVFTDIENYVPIGLAAFNELISLLDPPLALTLAPIIKDVKGAFADLDSIVTQYQNAPAADKATLKGKITTAINAVVDNLNQFWSDAGLPDGNLATTIIGVLQIIVSTLVAFLPLVGGVMLTHKKLTKTIPIVARSKKQLTKKAVTADINAAFVKGGYANKVY